MTAVVIVQQLFLHKHTTRGLSLQIINAPLVLMGGNLTILLPHLLPPIYLLLLPHHPAEHFILLDLLRRIPPQPIMLPLLIRPPHPFNLHKHPKLPRATQQRHHHHLRGGRKQTILTPDLTKTDELQQRLPQSRHTSTVPLKTLQEAQGSHLLPVPPNPRHRLMPPHLIGLRLLKMPTLNDPKIETRSVIDIESRRRNAIGKGTLPN